MNRRSFLKLSRALPLLPVVLVADEPAPQWEAMTEAAREAAVRFLSAAWTNGPVYLNRRRVEVTR